MGQWALLGKLGTALRGAIGPAAAGDAEGLHDLRVATRRARALVGQLDEALPGRDRKALRRGLRWLAKATGAARDDDVVSDLLAEIVRELPSADRRALAEALRAQDAQRVASHHRLRDALRSEASAALLDLFDALAAGEPAPARRRAKAGGPALVADDVAAMHGALASQSATEQELFAVAHQRCARAVQRFIAGLDDLPLADAVLPENARLGAFHALRLAVKKARYRLQWLLEAPRPPGMPRARGRKLLRRLVSLQQVLGELQDAVVTARRVQALVAGTSPRGQVALLHAAEALNRRAAAAEAQACALLPKVRHRAGRWLDRSTAASPHG